jgi:uncharacterized protein (TIGR02145 family)
VSTAQLLSVPYALYAKTAATATETKTYVDNIVLEVMNMFARTNERFTSLTAGILIDIEENSYHIIKIGTQWWMAENLKTIKYNDGSSIDAWNNTTGAYCWFEDNIANKDIYGALYNGYALNTGKLCPGGWHVPSCDEWTTLINFLGGSTVAGGKMKEVGTTHWQSPNAGATNESGFTGLPGSFRNSLGYFACCIGSTGDWWTATPPMGVDLFTITQSVEFMNGFPDVCGLSVRCVRD